MSVLPLESSPKLLTALMTVGLLLVSCTVVTIPVVPGGETPGAPFSELARLSVRCPSLKCRLASLELCHRALAREAQRLSADALLLGNFSLTERGSMHGGFKTTKVRCEGTAIGWINESSQ